ncbi:MAG: hypothetical protein JSW35_03140, partial [Deltaproteobacteria bacterium]
MEKEHKADVTVGEKVDTIVHEIEAAQGQKVTHEGVLERVFSHLEKEPSLTVPVIESLARIPNPDTAQLLISMMEKLQEKWVVKSIKRTLYKLRQKGVRWEQRPPEDKPILRPPKPAEPQGYLGAMDSTGSRIIVIARSQPLRGLLVVFS